MLEIQKRKSRDNRALVGEGMRPVLKIDNTLKWTITGKTQILNEFSVVYEMYGHRVTDYPPLYTSLLSNTKRGERLPKIYLAFDSSKRNTRIVTIN